MTIQASGTIKFSDINKELGRDLPNGYIEMGLGKAEAGIYGAINLASPNHPSYVGPATMSEWYSYNHNYTTTTTTTVAPTTTTTAPPCLGTNSYFFGAVSGFDTCLSLSSTVWTECTLAGSTADIGCHLYSDASCTPLSSGLYTYSSMVYDVGSAGIINNVYSCGA